MSRMTGSLRQSMSGIWAVLVILACAPDACPQDLRGVVNSPRAWGMGGCAIVLVDEESPLHNPGAMGVFHLTRIAAASLPNNTRWLPREPNLDIRMQTWSMSAGANSMVLPFKDTSVHVALAFGFSRISLRERSSYIEEMDIDYKLDNYSIGLAGEYFVRVGLGFTYSRSIWLDRVGSFMYEGVQSGGGWGALIEIPLTDLIRRLRNIPALEGARYELTVVPSIAYVSAARERDTYTYRPKPDLSDGYDARGARRFGAAIASTLAHKSLPLASCRLVYEHKREEIIPGRRAHTDKLGAEVGVLGFAYGRIGKLENKPDLVGSTFGFGASLRGLLVLLQRSGMLHAESALPRYVLEHFDISFDYARIEYETGSLHDWARFYKVRVSL